MSETPTKGDTIYKWWWTNLGNRDSGRARGLAARLRRATSIDVLMEPEVHELAQRLKLKSRDADRLVRLVQVLAEVRENGGRRLAQRLGEGEPPPLSPLRFQRLLRSQGEELTTAMRRALSMVKYQCNIASLGRDLLYWDHPQWDDETRTQWAFDYFGAPRPNDETDKQQNHMETEQ
ncbi:MAG: type I-E CRISPR-associated protein Cse2/CasB [Parvularcula sp.]